MPPVVNPDAIHRPPEDWFTPLNYLRSTVPGALPAGGLLDSIITARNAAVREIERGGPRERESRASKYGHPVLAITDSTTLTLKSKYYKVSLLLRRALGVIKENEKAEKRKGSRIADKKKKRNEATKRRAKRAALTGSTDKSPHVKALPPSPPPTIRRVVAAAAQLP